MTDAITPNLLIGNRLIKFSDTFKRTLKEQTGDRFKVPDKNNTHKKRGV